VLITPGNELSVLCSPVQNGAQPQRWQHILGVQKGGGLWQIIEELADGIYNSTMKGPSMQPYYAILISLFPLVYIMIIHIHTYPTSGNYI